MRGIIGLPVAAMVALVVAFGLAPGTAAAHHRADAHEPPEASFAVNGTNGFRVSFLLSADLFLAYARSGPYDTSYVVLRPEVEGDRFTGRLPGIGGVSVRFHQHGKTERQTTACSKDPPILTRKGVFVGTIHLRGEEGYTRVQATHANGSVTEDPSHFCTRFRSTQRARPAVATAGSTEVGSIQFIAEAPHVQVQAFQIGDEDEAGLSFVVGTHLRWHDGMLVSSSVRKTPRHPSILFSNETAFPEAATIAPGRPFTGSAKFGLLGPNSSTWTGDLEVTLPGVGSVRLAGPKFGSAICREDDCRGSLPFEITSQDSEGFVGYGPRIHRHR